MNMSIEEFYAYVWLHSDITREQAEAMTITEAIAFCKKEYNYDLIINLV